MEGVTFSITLWFHKVEGVTFSIILWFHKVGGVTFSIILLKNHHFVCPENEVFKCFLGMSLPFIGPGGRGFYLVLIIQSQSTRPSASYLETVLFVPSKTHARQVLFTVMYHSYYVYEGIFGIFLDG